MSECGTSVEVDSGLTYTIIKCTKGSFHQGHEKFSYTRGIQCTCISLYASLFSFFKHVSRWTKNDINCVLEKGDNLYKLQNTTQFLTCTELPRTVSLEGVNMDVNFDHNCFGFFVTSSATSINELISNLRSNLNNKTRIIFIINGVAVSILKCNRHYYIIDSHSRDANGRPCPDGTAVVLKFINLFEVAKYISKVYHNNSINPTQYDIQFISISVENVTEADKAVILEGHKAPFLKVVSSPKKKFDNKSNSATNCKNLSFLLDTVDTSIKGFRQQIFEGPSYVCVICGRCLYKKSVVVFDPLKCSEIGNKIYKNIQIENGLLYICNTCKQKVKNGKVPCQAMANKLYVNDIPNELKCLNKLEAVLISKRILFKKIAIMSKGQMPKVKGAICNIPVDVDNTCNSLPRNIDSSGILLVKLKKKLQFNGHVYYEPVSPAKVGEALTYLKLNNKLYSDVHINVANISEELLNLHVDEEICIELDSSTVNDNLETYSNPLDSFRQQAGEMCIIPEHLTTEIFEIAPGEGQVPTSILNDQYCEELSFPILFSLGEFGYKVERDVKLSPVKYFNQRLLHYKQTFASSSDYIFFVQFVLQQLSFNNQISIAMRKSSANVTAGMLQQGYSETIQSLVSTNKAFVFMNQIKGTPAYWKRFQLEVLAMIRQLGCPTFFLTLSCADLQWDELVSIISKLDMNPLSEEAISNLTYFERCEILNKNPVLVARHLQYRVELLFRNVLLRTNLLGEILYYAIRVEFQFRGTQHTHSFIWVKDAPTLTESNISNYINFLDFTTHAYLPREKNELYNLVKKYQTHKHSKSCRKYKNTPCRYNFGRFFTQRTIVACPISSKKTTEEQFNDLTERNNILSRVKTYINEYLDPSKQGYKGDSISISDILNELNIVEKDYYHALSISSSTDYEIHLKRLPDSCFINNYNPYILKAWQANMDIQPVFNYYKAVSYMCSYFSKSESESSQALIQASKEIQSMKLRTREAMYKLASAYATSRQMSLQEAVVFSLPELWLRKCFPRTIFVNTNIPTERIRLCKPKALLNELDSESTDIYAKNMIDRYMDRPDSNFCSGRYASVDDMCLAMFLSHYCVKNDKIDNEFLCDFQPVILTADISENSQAGCNFPSIIPLMSCKEKLVCRKVRQILRYSIPNNDLFPERHAHYLLFLFLPFRSETELLINNSYCEKLLQHGVLDVVNVNRSIFEPFSDDVNAAYMRMSASNNVMIEDTIVTEQTDQLNLEEVYQQPVLFNSVSNNSISSNNLISDDTLRQNIRSLNQQQRLFFDFLYEWANNKVKQQNCNSFRRVEPLQVFVTGGAGVGKSYLINTIYQSLSKLFNLYSGTPEKCKVLKVAPTGVAAINIDGTTINSAFGIPKSKSLNLHNLSDNLRCKFRDKYSHLNVVIIDEISMVSNVKLYHIHKRLCEIFQMSLDNPFANKTILAVGDLYQLPPVQEAKIFTPFKHDFLNICHPWKSFKLYELSEIMRQQGDDSFIKLLNNVRNGEVGDKDLLLLNSRIAKNIPVNSIYLFAENSLKDQLNLSKLSKLEGENIVINSLDKFPENVSISKINQALDRNVSQTNGLCKSLIIKRNALIMLTNNIDIDDRLINGQIGLVRDIQYNNDGTIQTIFVKFNDHQAGILKMRSNQYAFETHTVPIKRIQASIPVSMSSVSSPAISRTQFPIMLAWGCTVHKVQGLTLPNVVVSFKLLKQKTFNFGQIYVALSRVKKLAHIHIEGIPTLEACRADPKVSEEYTRLKTESALSIDKIQPLADTFQFALLNIRSLSKHALDLSHDIRLTNADVVCLTETQLLDNSLHPTLQEHFLEHDLFLHNNADRFKSLAFLKKQYLQCNILRLQSALYLEFFSTSDHFISLILFYKSNNCHPQRFADYVSNLVELHKPDFVLGDFNSNALCDILPPVLTRMNELNYKLLVTEPTHILGGLIDHVYVNNEFHNIENLSVAIIPVYYSDHCAISVQIKHW